tara:strand:+ start:1024 stop:1500 length:477 start_codon:yes stop_codon:yes gene_type:complete
MIPTQEQDKKNARRLQNIRNQRNGSDGELIAHRALHNLGYHFINKINTPWLITRSRTGKVLGAKACGTVTGDLRAVAPGGISVLAEVKRHNGPRLTYSTLEAHQHEDLAAHNAVEGISLLIWIHEREAYILRYPIAGFVPRSSLKIDDVRKLALKQSL